MNELSQCIGSHDASVKRTRVRTLHCHFPSGPDHSQRYFLPTRTRRELPRLTTEWPWAEGHCIDAVVLAVCKGKTASRVAVSRNPARCFDQAAAAAATFFRLLRQPIRPIAPRPAAKSGNVPGRGVGLGSLPLGGPKGSKSYANV